jgi:hypothetical protein
MAALEKSGASREEDMSGVVMMKYVVRGGPA